MIARALVLAAVLLGTMPGSGAPLPLVTLTKIATLQQPVAMAVRAGDEALWIAEKTGRVRRLEGEETTTALDISGEVSTGGEQGLLGLAFDPDGSTMYVNFTDLGGDTHVTAFEVDGNAADLSTRSEILFVEQPFANHNGGALAFGPDGYLYVALGDGGGGGDPLGAGQRLDVVLGKILRIDPRPGENPPYVVPPTNPFVGVEGARAEIWSYGLRNPWRFSFDRLTGDLWIGDVGQNMWEEIDFQSRASMGGENYGWNEMEGTHPYNGGSPPAGHVPPVHEYSHAAGGCSVTGGYVYRGTRFPALHGAYVFADFCAGRLQALVTAAGVVTLPLDLVATAPLPASFGEDASGELYVLSLNGAVWRIDPAL